MLIDRGTSILILIEGHKTAFNGFEYQFTTGKPLKYLQPTMIMEVAQQFFCHKRSLSVTAEKPLETFFNLF
jgi:hypothetical protein